MHLVDTTLFYSPTSGGVKRYLTAKHSWLRANTSWEHTIVVPGEEDYFERGEVCALSGFPVPGTFNYRLPLNPRRWSRLLSALQPSIIEAGDAFQPAWGALDVARRRGIPVVVMAGGVSDEAMTPEFAAFDAVVPICPRPMRLDEALTRARANLVWSAEQLGNMIGLLGKTTNHRAFTDT